MNVVVFCFTVQGMETARRIRDTMTGNEVHLVAPARLAGDGFMACTGELREYVGSVFDRDALIFVGACGIAVRAIAPHVTSKCSDPAVICVDERAQFVISILSGHIGGANALSRFLAETLGATAVITTATDINGRFSVDAWASERGMIITSMALAKQISARILTDDIPFCADCAVPDTGLPKGLIQSDAGELGICVSVRDRQPYEKTLLLVPRALRLGLGCRRGVTEETVEAAILKVFRENNLRIEAVAEAATIDLKRDEAGLNACCRNHGWTVVYYTAQQLDDVSGVFVPSDFVQRTVGVDNVCERAAAASGGRIIVPKTVENGITVAVAELEWSVDFG